MENFEEIVDSLATVQQNVLESHITLNHIESIPENVDGKDLNEVKIDIYNKLLQVAKPALEKAIIELQNSIEVK